MTTFSLEHLASRTLRSAPLHLTSNHPRAATMRSSTHNGLNTLDTLNTLNPDFLNPNLEP
jgi:hypothetical protein